MSGTSIDGGQTAEYFTDTENVSRGESRAQDRHHVTRNIETHHVIAISFTISSFTHHVRPMHYYIWDKFGITGNISDERNLDYGLTFVRRLRIVIVMVHLVRRLVPVRRRHKLMRRTAIAAIVIRGVRRQRGRRHSMARTGVLHDARFLVLGAGAPEHPRDEHACSTEHGGVLGGTIRYRGREPSELLRLRGGGPLPGAGKGGHERILGAGVGQWLEDSDYEDQELAEAERRRTEADICNTQVGSERGSLSQIEGRQPPPQPTIWGDVRGKGILVCMSCFRDNAPENIAGRRVCCGALVCLGCAACACPRCPQAVGEQRIEISLHDAISGGLTPSSEAAETDIGAWAWQRTADTAHTPTVFRMDADDADEDVPCSGESDHRAPEVSLCCARCGGRAAQGFAHWYICRCGTSYCLSCSAEPCIECPALGAVHSSPDHAEVNEVGAGEGTYPVPTYNDAPTILTPSEAAERRSQMLRCHKEDMDRRRADRRRRRCEQYRSGRRPQREKTQRAATLFATANVTAESTWRAEAAHGRLLHRHDYVFIQEHGQRGEDQIESTRKWLMKQGSDAIVDTAYFKNCKAGGGTAITARANGGLRRCRYAEASDALKQVEGRLSIGIGNMGFDFAAASIYGHSGADLGAQLALYKSIMMSLKKVGLPFVIGGDWQLPPEAIAKSGILQILDAIICAPGEPTNAVTGTTIDYFVGRSRCTAGPLAWITVAFSHRTASSPWSCTGGRPGRNVLDSCDPDPTPRHPPRTHDEGHLHQLGRGRRPERHCDEHRQVVCGHGVRDSIDFRRGNVQ